MPVRPARPPERICDVRESDLAHWEYIATAGFSDRIAREGWLAIGFWLRPAPPRTGDERTTNRQRRSLRLTPCAGDLRMSTLQTMAKQVFYDPMQARWKRIRRIFDAAALAFSLLVIFFIYSALRSEPLPDLSWLSEKKPYHALKEDEKTKAREKRRLATVARSGHRHQAHKAPSQLTLN